MISYPNAFHAELDKQIRRRGYCQIVIYLSENETIQIDDYTIKSAEFVLRSDPMCRELPTEECVISLLDFEKIWHPDNPNGRYADAGSGSKVNIKFGIDTESGSVSWGPWMTFFLTANPEWRDNVATFTGTRQLGRLTNEFYKMGSNETLRSVAVCAAEDGLEKVGYSQSEMEYDISADLDDVQVIENTTLEGYTVANALMSVAFAGKKNIRTKFGGTNGIIEIKDCIVENPQRTNILIPLRDMFLAPVSERIPLIRNEIVTYYKEPKDEPETALVLQYSGNEITGSDPVFLPTEQPIIPTFFSITHATNTSGFVVADGKYRNGIEMHDVEIRDPTLPITFDGTGKVMVRTPATMTVTINADGTEDEKIDNPLLTESTVHSVAAYRGNYLSNTRSKFQIDYRGNPAIEPFDLVRVELPYVGFAECIVLENRFRYSGGFSGSLVVRKLNTVTASQTISSAVSGVAVSDEAVSDTEV